MGAKVLRTGKFWKFRNSFISLHLHAARYKYITCLFVGSCLNMLMQMKYEIDKKKRNTWKTISFPRNVDASHWKRKIHPLAFNTILNVFNCVLLLSEQVSKTFLTHISISVCAYGYYYCLR